MPTLRDAFRGLRSTPLVTAGVVVSLALGIGANTAAFSLLDAALLRPLPVHDPHRLVMVAAPNAGRSAWPQSVWAEIRDREILDGGFAWFWSRFDTAERGERQFVGGMAASGRLFASLGVRPVVGRLLTPADDDPGAAPDGAAAVISYRFWQRRYGGTPDVVGRSLSIDRRSFTIVGVTPPEFVGLHIGLPLDVVIPLGPPSIEPGGPYVRIMGRLKPGETPETVTAALRVAQPLIRDATNPYSVSPYREAFLREPFTVRAVPAGVSFLERRYGPSFRTLPGVVGLVLLIACGNIAMLLLARATMRQHELGVRAALGASGTRLAWQLCVESLLLSAGGVALGVLFARWGTGVVMASLSTQAYTVFLDLRLDWRVFAFTSAVGLVTAVLFGAAPALQAMRTDPMEALRQRRPGHFRRSGLTSGIVVTQVALSLMLVIGTGLFLRTFRALASIDVGFAADRVLIATIDAHRSASAPEDPALPYDAVLDAVAASPGVEGAAVSLAVPGGNSAWTPWIELSDGTALPQGANGVYANYVTPGWFQAMGTGLIGGREFQARDRHGAAGVAVVNEAFVRRFLPEQSPIGRTIVERSRPDGPLRRLEIVGVAQDAMYRFVRESPPPTIYTPLAQMPDPLPATVTLIVRAGGRPTETLTRAVAGAILGVTKDVSLTFRTLEDQVSAQYAQERLVARLAAIFGALAVLLAALGLHGITAYAAERRRFEIGIRIALGAAAGSVVRLVLARVVVLVSVGLALGLAGGIWTAQFARAMLYRVEPGDPITLVGSCALLIMVAAVAGWLPAYRAARLDPTELLKEA